MFLDLLKLSNKFYKLAASKTYYEVIISWDDSIPRDEWDYNPRYHNKFFKSLNEAFLFIKSYFVKNFKNGEYLEKEEDHDGYEYYIYNQYDLQIGLIRIREYSKELNINSKIIDFSNTLFSFIEFLKNFHQGIFYTTNSKELYLLINIENAQCSPNANVYSYKCKIIPWNNEIYYQELFDYIDTINIDFPNITKEDIEVSLDELKDKGLIPNEQITSEVFKNSFLL